jgi:hypothetical protein
MVAILSLLPAAAVAAPITASSITYGTYQFGGVISHLSTNMVPLLPGLSNTFSGSVTFFEPDPGSEHGLISSTVSVGSQVWNGTPVAGYRLPLLGTNMLTFGAVGSSTLPNGIYIEDLLLFLPTQSAAGHFSATFAGPSLSPTQGAINGAFTSFTRVPEPATWILTLAGVIAAARRRLTS